MIEIGKELGSAMTWAAFWIGMGGFGISKTIRAIHEIFKDE